MGGKLWIFVDQVENATNKVGALIKTTELGTDMFRGLHEHNLDAKGRVSMPVRFRELLSPEKDTSCKFVLTTGLEKCLVLYPENVWMEFESNSRLSRNSTPPWFRSVASTWLVLPSALWTSMDGS